MLVHNDTPRVGCNMAVVIQLISGGDGLVSLINKEHLDNQMPARQQRHPASNAVNIVIRNLTK